MATVKKQKSAKSVLRRKRLIFIWGMLAYPLLQYLIFFVYVNINTVVMSFQQLNYVTGETIPFTLQNYERFFYEIVHFDEIRTAIFNSIRAGLNNVLLILVSLFAGYFFYKKVPGGQMFRVIFYLPSIISIVVYTTAYKYMFNQSIGPINKILLACGMDEGNLPIWFMDRELALPLVFIYCIWVGVGYNVLIYSGGISKIPEDVMEYAKIDGVGMFRELFQMVIPMMWPTVAVSIIGCVTVMFTFFIQIQMLTGGGPDGSTNTIAFMINSKVKGAGANLEWAATLGVCFTLIATPLILLIRKFNDKMSEKFGF